MGSVWYLLSPWHSIHSKTGRPKILVFLVLIMLQVQAVDKMVYNPSLGIVTDDRSLNSLTTDGTNTVSKIDWSIANAFFDSEIAKMKASKITMIQMGYRHSGAKGELYKQAIYKANS